MSNEKIINDKHRDKKNKIIQNNSKEEPYAHTIPHGNYKNAVKEELDQIKKAIKAVKSKDIAKFHKNFYEEAEAAKDYLKDQQNIMPSPPSSIS